MSRVLIILFGLVCAIVVILGVGWVLWWLWKRRDEKGAPLVAKTEKAPSPLWEERRPPLEAPLAFEGKNLEEPPPPDDLTRIEGIGPRIAEVLQEAGLRTFAQLAAADVGQIEQILERADPRLRGLADPTTWPEQAALAAEGRWDVLAELQQRLKGGRQG
ncbi:MAG: helix-hairpin-helix domain-containing protein [Anaerolineae bacterium]